jgi:tRNA C32,U32 (ribose-2'-O)-methylase TrmJ
MSKIGQLSTANDSSDTADRHEMSGKIDNTENGLNAIKRPLSADEQKTVALIRSYITRARDALKADDLDGAKILRDKAQQLLEELTKQ